MDSLKIEAVENGFVVYEQDRHKTGMQGKVWAFETAATLAQFTLEYAEQTYKGVTHYTNAVTGPR